MPERPRRWKAVGLVLAGILAGTLLIQPVGAHFTQNTRHLGVHAWTEFIRDRVYTRNQANNRYYTKAQIDRDATGCQGVPGDVMVKVGGICIDAYEASIWDAPVGGTQITGTIPCNANGQDCDNIYARSVEAVEPRANITWFQAQAALANSGKRLPSNAEWQMTVRGTPDSSDCNVGTGLVANTGSNTDCVSAFGAFDMVGNLWEWVADWDEVAADCDNWSSDFGDDFTCMGRGEGDANNHFPGALIRGGSLQNTTGAGPFAVVGSLQPSDSFSDIGFRGAR